MKPAENISDKIMSRSDLKSKVNSWKSQGKKIVFTNGCFDILHRGHLEILSQAAGLGDKLIIGVNADESVKRLKGPSRPVNNESSRSIMLAFLEITDAVSIFEEDTPLELIQTIQPDIIVKGGDYKPSEVVGAEEVAKNGGEVIIVPLVKGFSTTGIIEKIQHL